jgi:hypothetical protein
MLLGSAIELGTWHPSSCASINFILRLVWPLSHANSVLGQEAAVRPRLFAVRSESGRLSSVILTRSPACRKPCDSFPTHAGPERPGPFQFHRPPITGTRPCAS